MWVGGEVRLFRAAERQMAGKLAGCRAGAALDVDRASSAECVCLVWQRVCLFGWC
jgi:hypothetical protein